MKHSFTIAAGYVDRFYQSLIDLGISEKQILSISNLKKELLKNPDNRIPIDTYIQLCRAAPLLTNIPEVGLVLGQRAHFKHIGVIYQLASQCETIEDSLFYTAKYSNLINETRKTEFKKGKNNAEWSVQYIHPKYRCITTIEFEACQALKILKCLFGNDFKPVQIKFQHAAPAYVHKYQETFNAPLLFRQTKCGFVFDKKLLHTPNPDPQPYIKELLMKHADMLNSEVVKNQLFQDKVKKIIMKHLEDGSVNLSTISDELNLSSRTVYRKLKKENISYKELLNDVQKHLAQDYLLEKSSSINDISQRLGFSEPSAFHRAFKRWFGTNPSQYRQQINGDYYTHP